jgi:hydroxyacylglutathione hydrolase
MLIERIWAANELRNYHYLVADEASGEALAIDPLDASLVLARARERGWTITQVLNTHEHHDHTGGNAAVVAATGARVLAHAAAAARIGGVDRGLADGDEILIGRHTRLRCLDTPGHTLAHICLHADGDEPALFSGDTLFHAGVGHCRSGDPVRLYETCSGILAHLPPATRVYPGHDYLRRNLDFTLSLESGNTAAAELLERTTDTPAEALPILTLADEFRINVFFRLAERELIRTLAAVNPSVDTRDARAVFLGLRELRNDW